MNMHEPVTCQWCEREQPTADAYLGPLGNYLHLQCRYCGGQWTVRPWRNRAQEGRNRAAVRASRAAARALNRPKSTPENLSNSDPT